MYKAAEKEGMRAARRGGRLSADGRLRAPRRLCGAKQPLVARRPALGVAGLGVEELVEVLLAEHLRRVAERE